MSDLRNPTPATEFSVAPFSGGQEVMDVIAALHLRVRHWQREQGYNPWPDRILDSQADLTSINDYYTRPGGNFFVAARVSDAAEIAGFIGARRDSEQQATLMRLAVMPEYQRRGIGSLLVSTAVDWASRTGLQKLTLSTGKDETGRPIYERYGFVVTGYNAIYEHHDMELVLPAASIPKRSS